MALREACVGGTACACAAPGLGLKPASRCSDKSHLLGASPLFFTVVGTRRRGLRVSRHVGLLLAPRPHVSQLHGGRRPLIAECRCPAVIRGLAGHCSGKRGRLGPDRAPWKSSALDLVAPGASPGSCHGAWFSAGECHLRTPWTGGRGCLHREGVAALEDKGRSRHAPLGRSLVQTLES